MIRRFYALAKCMAYFCIYVIAQIVGLTVTLLFKAAHLLYSGLRISETQLFVWMENNLVIILLVANIFCLAVFWICANHRHRSLAEHVAIYPMNPYLILPLIFLGLFLNVFCSSALELITFPQAWVEAYEEANAPLNNAGVVVTLLSVVLLGPIIEEILFRGLIYTRLCGAMRALPAAILSAIVFGVMHGSLIWFFYTLPMGLIFVWVFRRCRSLWGSILLHMTFNFANIPLAYIQIDNARLWMIAFSSGLCCILCALWLRRLTPIPSKKHAAAV